MRILISVGALVTCIQGTDPDLPDLFSLHELENDGPTLDPEFEQALDTLISAMDKPVDFDLVTLFFVQELRNDPNATTDAILEKVSLITPTWGIDRARLEQRRLFITSTRMVPLWFYDCLSNVKTVDHRRDFVRAAIALAPEYMPLYRVESFVKFIATMWLNHCIVPKRTDPTLALFSGPEIAVMSNTPTPVMVMSEQAFSGVLSDMVERMSSNIAIRRTQAPDFDTAFPSPMNNWKSFF